MGKIRDLFGANKKKIGVVVSDSKTGKEKILLNPNGKAEKFADELRTKIRYINDGQYKADKDGNIGLSDTQAAYRSGYLDARKDNARVYKSKQKST